MPPTEVVAFQFRDSEGRTCEVLVPDSYPQPPPASLELKRSLVLAYAQGLAGKLPRAAAEIADRDSTPPSSPQPPLQRAA